MTSGSTSNTTPTLPFCSQHSGGFSITKNGVSACISQTLLTYIPFLFIIVSGYLRIKEINNNGGRGRMMVLQQTPSTTTLGIPISSNSFLNITKKLCTILLMLIPIGACADTFRSSNYDEFGKKNQSIALIISTILKVFFWGISYYIMKREDQCGARQTLTCIRSFWIIAFFCSAISSVSAIPDFEALSSSTQLVLCCAEFGITSLLALLGACYKTCLENDVSIFGDNINGMMGGGSVGGNNNANGSRSLYDDDMQRNKRKSNNVHHSKFSSIQSSGRISLLEGDNLNMSEMNDGDDNSSNFNILDTSIDDGTLREGRRSFDHQHGLDFREIEGLGDSKRSPYTGGYHTLRSDSASAKKKKNGGKKTRSNTQDIMWKRFKEETGVVEAGSGSDIDITAAPSSLG